MLVLTQSGPRYGDYKCIHDRTHRVCAKLVDNSNGRCDALSWNSNGQSFWQITGQERWNWKDRICNAPNPGDSWCICLWATANLIDAVKSLQLDSYRSPWVSNLWWMSNSVANIFFCRVMQKTDSSDGSYDKPQQLSSQYASFKTWFLYCWLETRVYFNHSIRTLTWNTSISRNMYNIHVYNVGYRWNCLD